MEGDPEGTDIFINMSDDGESCDMTSEDVDVLLQELKENNLREDFAQDFFVKQKAAKLRTWRTNKDLKKAAVKDRGYTNLRIQRLQGAAIKPNRPMFRKKLCVQEIQSRTNCRRCGERGHWARECKKGPATETALINWTYVSTSEGIFIIIYVIFIL